MSKHYSKSQIKDNIDSKESVEEICELGLCESRHLCLKPDTTYRFKVDENCPDCLEMAEIADPKSVKIPTYRDMTKNEADFIEYMIENQTLFQCGEIYSGGERCRTCKDCEANDKIWAIIDERKNTWPSVRQAIAEITKDWRPSTPEEIASINEFIMTKFK